MPTPPKPKPDYVSQLTEAVRNYIRDDMVNQYTALSPVKAADGSTTMTVKDKRHSGQLEIIVRAKKEGKSDA
jgi:hypothetical protein